MGRRTSNIWRIIGAAASVGFIPQAVHASGDGVHIPIEASDGGYRVASARVNSGAFGPAVIDTAATLAMIDAAAAARAGVAPPGAGPVRVDVFGLFGAATYSMTTLDQLEAGDWAAVAVPSAFNDRADMPGAHLVIPARMLGDDVLDFDFPMGVVRAYAGRPLERGGEITLATGLEEEDGLYFVQVTINGVAGRALIDTGSPVSIVNSAFANAAAITADAQKTKSLTGATGGLAHVRVGTARHFDLGGFEVSRFDIIVADPPLFENLGLRDAPAMLLGLDILSSFRVQIDQRRSRLVLSSSTAHYGAPDIHGSATRLGK